MLQYTENSTCVNKYAATIYSPTAPEHHHTFFEIAFARRGTSTHVINGRAFVFSRGVCTIIRPTDTHFYTGNFDNPKTYYHTDVYVPVARFKTICDMLQKNLYEHILQHEGPITFFISNDFIHSIEQQINILINNCNSTDVLDALHFSIVCSIISKYIESVYVQKKYYPTWLNDLLIDLNSPKFMSMAIVDLAKKYGYSPEHFSRSFKNYTNEKLVDYITKQKINYSLTLLQTQTMSISEIAQILGYQKQSTFTENFKKLQGCTPTEYLKRIIK